MLIEILKSSIAFFRAHVEIFVTLSLAIIGSIVWVIKSIIYRNRNLNTIYSVHGKKSSSINWKQLSNRPESVYYELEENQALKKAMERGVHVLVLSPLLTGKTRGIYQALKTMNPTTNIIIPRLQNIELEKFELPFNFAFWRKNLLVLDDIDKFIDMNNFKFMVDEFLKKKAVIIASCRSGNEFEKLSKTEWLCILFKEENIIKFPQNISDERGKEIAAKLKVEWNPIEFDGKIGSLFVPLDAMKNRFIDCSPGEKSILKSIRLLYKAGIYQEKEYFSTERITHLCKDLFGNNFERYQFDELFLNLEKKDFIKIINDEVVWAEEAYLEFVIEADRIEANKINFFFKIKNYFSNDAEALSIIGNIIYRRTLEALNDNLRQATLFVLVKNGELSFTQILAELEIPHKDSSILSHHLKILEKGALIKKKSAKKEDVDSRSFYALTDFGEDILDGLNTSLDSKLAFNIQGFDKIEALNDSLRQANLFALLKNGKLLSFSQILTELQMLDSSILSHHLKILEKGALIKKKSAKNHSFYALTDFGEEILKLDRVIKDAINRVNFKK